MDPDLYLFAEGTHRRLWEVLGAHPMEIDGVSGVRFAVWAPRATRVSVVGDFCEWDGRRFPMQRLREQLDTHQPVGIVVGLPLAPDGSEDERAAGARAVGGLIAEKTGLPVCYWDERMTTARALGAIRDLGGNTRGRKGDVDQLAATVLLQHFLDSRRP